MASAANQPSQMAAKSRKSQRRTDMELAAEHQRRALTLRMRAQRTSIDKCLKNHPEDIQDVYDLLVHKGRLEPKCAPEPAQAGGGTGGTGERGDAADECKAEAAEQTDEAAKVEGGVVEPPSKEEQQVLDIPGARITDSYTRFGGRHSLPGKAWRAILEVLEPVACSRFSTQALIDKGKREICPEKATNIIEFMTGLDENTPLQGDLRDTLTLTRHLCALNDGNGRPAQQLRLPPDWSEQGWWIILEHDANSLSLGHRGSEKVVAVTPAQLGIEPGPNFLKVYASQNYSMRRATLADMSGTKSKQCYSLYMVAMKEEPAIETKVKMEPESASKRRRVVVKTSVVRDEAAEQPPAPPKASGEAEPVKHHEPVEDAPGGDPMEGVSRAA